jgi:hypothetical protein
MKTVLVTILGDSLPEPDETFAICLSNASQAVLAGACGVGTIVNDDTNQPPSVAIIQPKPGTQMGSCNEWIFMRPAR